MRGPEPWTPRSVTTPTSTTRWRPRLGRQPRRRGGSPTMSATPHVPVPQGLDGPLPMTLPRLGEKKRLGEPIVMVTAYDYPSAQVAEESGVDMVLVGDSGAMTVLGYPSTVPVSIDEMLMLAAAVRRGLRTPFLVADLPFGSYEASDRQAIETAQR